MHGLGTKTYTDFSENQLLAEAKKLRIILSNGEGSVSDARKYSEICDMLLEIKRAKSHSY